MYKTVKWLSSADVQHLKQADRILQDLQKDKVELYSPESSKYEIGNALLKGKGLKLSDATASLAALYALPIRFLPETERAAEESYRLGQRFDITYYDAVFLSLAKTIKGVLVTDNIKHQGRATKIKVVPLAEYSLA